MEEYVFEDVLAGSTATCGFPGLDTRVAPFGEPRRARTLFFPGCSLVNYGLPLVKAVHDLLLGAGSVEGMSLLCCGKILGFEPDGKAVRAAFEGQLRDHVAAAGVERIVAACPNCVAALRAALAQDERTAQVEVVPLPLVLAELGYAVDGDVAARMLAEALEAGEGFYEACADGVPEPVFCVHDSCPDRKTGEFADGVRALMPAGMTVEPAHARKRSQCCGSLVRAAGKPDVALAQSRDRGAEAVAAGGSGIVAACVSCSYLLSVSQRSVPVFHYLELLFDWRIDWQAADAYMKLRFLFDEAPEPQGEEGGARPFKGLSPAAPADGGGACAGAEGAAGAECHPERSAAGAESKDPVRREGAGNVGDGAGRTTSCTPAAPGTDGTEGAR